MKLVTNLGMVNADVGIRTGRNEQVPTRSGRSEMTLNVRWTFNAAQGKELKDPRKSLPLRQISNLYFIKGFNFTVMKNITKRQIVWFVILVLILLILLIIQFKPFVGEVQWNEVFAYSIMLLVVGGAYELWQWLKKQNKMYRFAFSIGLMSIIFLGWVSGAVGIIGSENNPVNLMYWAVPTVMIIGSFVSRFRSKGMSYTLFSTALVQFLVPVMALIISSEVSWGNAGVIGVFIINFIFVTLFAGSSWLFRQSSYFDSKIGYK